METVADYRPRIGDTLLARALEASGAVEIVGPKWCGKTTMAEQTAKSAVYLQDTDRRDEYARIIASQPSLLLKGDTPRLLDEWQDFPVVWDAVRFAVDRSQSMGQFILTGSAIPPRDQIKHTGTGRIGHLRLRPMTLFESQESDGLASLADIMAGDSVQGQGLPSLEEVASFIVRGGWPASVIRDDAASAQRPRNYVDSIVESDISRIDGVDKNPRRVRLLMRSLARNESTEVAMTTLRADMAADDGALSTNTISQYMNALRRLYILDEQEPWAGGVRSKVAQRAAPVRRYCDPSLAAALLRLTPGKLMTDFSTFGLLFESLCIRDLRVYAEANDANVWHYRDLRGLECDAIVECADGSWGAVEVKLESARQDEAAANLLRIQRTVHSQHGGEAAFLLIVTAGGYAYRRADGVYAVPITCLAP